MYPKNHSSIPLIDHLRKTSTCLAFLGTVVSVSATSYFVDSMAGSDSNVGTSASTPWKTLNKVNARTYLPGDQINLMADSVWNGQQLLPKGSGVSGNPIVIDVFGSGAKPLLNGNGANHNTVYLINQSYWEINNLEVTNNAGSSANNLGDYRGISINGQNGGTLNHIQIKNCDVHDVTGEVKWISGSTSGNQTGVTFATGWDASKRTGGIVFEILSSTMETRFNDVLVEGCTVKKCSFGGIVFKQWDGSVHWGVRTSVGDTNWTPHTNVTIRNNYINQSGSAFACNGIYLTDTKTATIQNNVVAGAGTCGIECYYCDAITIEKNETFGTVKKAGGADFNGIDPDKGTTNMIVEYNYSHDNGDGILICQFAFGSATVRYNILQNNSRYGIYLHSDSKSPASIYNNVVYTSKAGSKIVFGFGSSLAATYQFRNNIFYSTVSVATLTTGGGITYDFNSYQGISPPSDGHKVTSNPLLVNPGHGGNGTPSGPAISTLGGYKLQPGSPCINRGTAIPNNGGTDFWGAPLYHGVADIGATEF